METTCQDTFAILIECLNHILCIGRCLITCPHTNYFIIEVVIAIVVGQTDIIFFIQDNRHGFTCFQFEATIKHITTVVCESNFVIYRLDRAFLLVKVTTFHDACYGKRAIFLDYHSLYKTVLGDISPSTNEGFAIVLVTASGEKHSNRRNHE